MNPAVDVSSWITAMEPHRKLRCDNVRHHPGGGGVNVSRVLKRFKAETLSIFPAGGAMGVLFAQLLQEEGVRHIAVPIAGDTREDFSVSESQTGRQYRFILPGPQLSQPEIRACLETVTKRLRPGGLLVASGSLPPGVSDDFYAHLAGIATEASAKFVLDCSGTPLRLAVDRGGLFLIKPSQNELAELTGKAVNDREKCMDAARRIVDAKASAFVCVSLGAKGALLVGRGCAFTARAPQVDAQTTVGAGDSLLAALVWAFVHGAPPGDALKIAVAAGTASLLAPGTGLSTLVDIERLKEQVQVEAWEHAS